MRINRYAVAALAGPAALLVGGRIAAADSGDGSPAARCDQRLAKIAAERGVSVEQLQSHISGEALARIDAGAEKASYPRPSGCGAENAGLGGKSLPGYRHVRARIAARGRSGRPPSSSVSIEQLRNSFRQSAGRPATKKGLTTT
jgi:hypothetical protein